MTKAHALKRYYKKVYNIDLEGMTTAQVLKDMFKKKYDMDVEGNSFISVLENAMGNSGGDEGKTAVVGTAIVGQDKVGG